MKGFYRYEYVFWGLKQFFFSEFCQFHPWVSLFMYKITHAEKRDITNKKNNFARKVKGTRYMS
jgi:hypothetical protein